MLITISLLMMIVAVAVLAARPQYRHVSFGLILAAGFLFVMALI